MEYSYRFLNAETMLCTKCNVSYKVVLFHEMPTEVQRNILAIKGLETPDEIIDFLDYKEYFYYCRSCGSTQMSEDY